MKTHLLILLVVCQGPLACSPAKPTERSPLPTNEAHSERTLVDSAVIGDTDRKEIFDAILNHALTDPDLESFRHPYGTPGDRKFALVSNDSYGVPWPNWYVPTVNNFRSVRVLEGAAQDYSQPRLLGIRLDKFDLSDRPKTDPIRIPDGQIVITVMNAGGAGGKKYSIGGCSVYYDTKRTDDKWAIEYQGAEDP
jgi:hypothetical protein